MLDKKYHYHVVFKAHLPNGRISEHTRYVDLESPLEYASDIQMVEHWCSEQVGAINVMMKSWTLLKGNIRPFNNRILTQI